MMKASNKEKFRKLCDNIEQLENIVIYTNLNIARSDGYKLGQSDHACIWDETLNSVIVIRHDNNIEFMVCILAHELAHYYLHRDNEIKSKIMMEIEAWSVALNAAKHFKFKKEIKTYLQGRIKADHSRYVKTCGILGNNVKTIRVNDIHLITLEVLSLLVEAGLESLVA